MQKLRTHSTENTFCHVISGMAALSINDEIMATESPTIWRPSCGWRTGRTNWKVDQKTVSKVMIYSQIWHHYQARFSLAVHPRLFITLQCMQCVSAGRMKECKWNALTRNVSGSLSDWERSLEDFCIITNVQHPIFCDESILATIRKHGIQQRTI